SLAAVTIAATLSMSTASPAAFGSNPEPVRVTCAPGTSGSGVAVLTEGAADDRIVKTVVSLTVPLMAMMPTSPIPTAVPNPESDTVAREGFVVVHEWGYAGTASCSVICNCNVSPTWSVADAPVM